MAQQDPLVLVPPANDPGPGEAAAKESAGTRRVLLNLGLLIVLGVGISGWMLYYTDWFPVFGGLLGLGGLFAWIAFVSGLLRGERKKQFQEGFERLVLLERRTWMAVLLAGGLFFLWASLHGSIVVQSLADESDRTVTVESIGAKGAKDVKEKPETSYLPPRARQKSLVFTGWTGREYRVKASGLPAETVRVAPLQRRTVASPSSFTARPVLLVRPEPRVAANAERNRFELVVRRDREVVGRIARGQYRGEAVWVGCDADVLVPATEIDRWRLEMVRDGVPGEVLTRWTAPLAVAEDTALRAGDRIRVELLRPDGGAYVTGEVTVQPLFPGRGFVQELPLKIPRPPADAGEVETDVENPSS